MPQIDGFYFPILLFLFLSLQKIFIFRIRMIKKTNFVALNFEFFKNLCLWIDKIYVMSEDDLPKICILIN